MMTWSYSDAREEHYQAAVKLAPEALHTDMTDLAASIRIAYPRLRKAPDEFERAYIAWRDRVVAGEHPMTAAA